MLCSLYFREAFSLKHPIFPSTKMVSLIVEEARYTNCSYRNGHALSSSNDKRSDSIWKVDELLGVCIFARTPSEVIA